MIDPVTPPPPASPPPVAAFPQPLATAISPATNTAVVSSGSPPRPPRKLGKGFKIAAILIVVFLVLTIGVSGVMAAIAYEKIKINNPSIERPVTQFVLSLPFTPKTPKYVLESAALAHSSVSKHSFDVSLAAKTENVIEALGLNQIDISAKGSVDYADPKNLRTSLNASITRDFNADIRKNDSKVFFKINNIPSFLLTAFKLDEAKIKPILENWIGYDTKPLDTEARKVLNEASPQKSVTKEYVTNTIDDLLDAKLLAALQLTHENLDNHSDYKLHLLADNKVIDDLVYKIQQRSKGEQGKNERTINFDNVKPSSYIKDLNIDLWMDEKDHYIRKIVTTFKFNPNYNGPATPTQVLGISKVMGGGDVLGTESSALNPLGKTEYSIAAAVKFDDFGKEVEVKAPAKYLKPEEFYKKILETSDAYKNLSYGGYGIASDSAELGR